jgi:DNA-directed RNA polymerase specialized sigma24 family protein
MPATRQLPLTGSNELQPFPKKSFTTFLNCHNARVRKSPGFTDKKVGMAELGHWQMWRERCALARCTETASHDLRGFAFDRFQRHLQKSGQALAPPKAADAWHAFESHLALGRNRSAKAWKEWLFARGGDTPTIDCIQGGATLIMRGVVREYLRREQAPGWMLSLDSPIGRHPESGSAPISLEDLLPDPEDPIAAIDQQELQALATRLFPSMRDLLTPRERLALITNQTGKALSHPAVAKAAQCGKSSLCNALHRAMQRLAQTLQTALPQESPNQRITVATLLIEKMKKDFLQTLEIEHPDLFRYMKEDTGNAC